MKNTRKISVLISIVLIFMLALGAVSAADDSALSDNDGLAAADDVQTVDNAQTIDEIDFESNDIVVTDTGDSSDSNKVSDNEEISDNTGLQDQTDGDNVAVSDENVNSKNLLTATSEPDEPLGAPDGSFRDLNTLISNARDGSTITLDRNYVYNPSTDRNYRDGILVNKTLTINGNGFTIDGQGTARGFILGGYTTSNWAGALTYHGYTYGLNGINFVNLTTTAAAGAAIASHTYPNTVTVTNCNFTNNKGGRGAVSISVQNPTGIIGPFVDTGSVTITGSIFKDNYASANSNGGGAIYSGISNDRSSLTLRNNAFVNNTAAATVAQVIYYANANYIHIDYNWWGQNNWNNAFVANSNTNYMTPDYYYVASISQTGANAAKVTLALNGGTAPSGSTLPARNATFSIGSGAITPETAVLQGSVTADYVASTDTTITAKIDNATVTLNVYKSPKWDINQLDVTVDSVTYPTSPVLNVQSDVDGAYAVTIGSYTGTVNVQNGQGTLTLDGFTAGDYTAIVSRTNDPVYNDKFAFASFTVNKADTSISIAANASQIAYGESVTITPTVEGITAADVTYYVDGAEKAGPTFSDLAVGTHTVVAKFAGNSTHNAAESNSLVITVTGEKINTSIIISADKTVIEYGESVTITPEVTGITADDVTYYVDGAEKESPTFTDLAIGAHSVVAKYAGDETHEASESNILIITVNKIETEISITSNKNEIEYGESVTITPEVTGFDDDVVYYVDGVAKYSNVLSDLAIGAHSVVAKYAGDETHESAESNILIITVTKIGTSISIAADDTEIEYGESVIITPTVDGITAEDVVYYVDGLEKEGPTFSDLAVGTHNVVAKFAGNTTHNAAESNVLFITVTDEKIDTSISIAANASQIAYGESVTITPTVAGITAEDVSYYVDDVKHDSNVLSGLAIGTHNVVAKFAGNSTHNAAESNVLVITVTKIGTSITIAADDTEIEYGGSVTITPTVAGITAEDVSYYVDDVKQDGNVLSGLAVGTHAVVAKYAGDETHESAESNILIITVNKIGTSISIAADDTEIEYGESVTITPTVDGITADDLTYYVDGLAKDSNVLSDLAVGTHTVVAKFAGDETHEAAESNALTITVSKVTPHIYLWYYNLTYPTGLAFGVELDDGDDFHPGNPFNGVTVLATIGGDVYADVTRIGMADFDFGVLNVGEYTITINTVATDNLNAASRTFPLIVGKGSLTISVDTSASSILYGETISFTNTITARPGATTAGTVTYYVDGTAIKGDSISTLSAGEHSVVAKYTGDPNLNDTESEPVSFNVILPSIDITAEDVTVAYPNNTTIRVTTNAAGTYTIRIDGRTYDVELEAGENQVYVPYILNPDEYAVRISADIPNYNHLPEREIATYTVTKGTIHITAEDVTVTYPGKGTITFTCDVIGDYNITIGTKTYNNVHFSMGSNEFEVPDSLDAGTYDVSVTAVANNLYDAVNALNIAVYDVGKGSASIAISADKDVIMYGGTVTITPVISTEDITEADLTYYVDESPVNSPTLYDLTAGVHTVVAKFAGNLNYEAAESNAVTITVNKAIPTISVTVDDVRVGQDININVLVSDNDGNPIDGVDVEIHIDSVIYYGTTDAEGKFTKVISSESFSIESYIVTAIVNDDSYEMRMDSDNFMIYDFPELSVDIDGRSYGEDAIIAVGLKTPQGDNLDGVVYVTVDDTTVAVAVSEGYGELAFPGLTAGTHTFTAVSQEVGYYKPASQAAKTFKVNPRVVLIEVDNFGGAEYCGEGRFEVTLYDIETDERIKDTVELIFTDMDDMVVASTPIETTTGPWDRGDPFDVTENLDMGMYYVTVSNPNYVFMGTEEGKFSFALYGDDEGMIPYTTGTIEQIDEEDLEEGFTAFKVLSDEMHDDYVGKIFYINEDDDPYEDLAQLYIRNNEGELYPIDNWIQISEIHTPLDPARYEYPVHKIYLDIKLVYGDGDYYYGDEHEVAIDLVKEGYDEFYHDCEAIAVVLKFNGETEEWDEVDTIPYIYFEEGRLYIESDDLYDLEPGQYKLKISIFDDEYELHSWIDDEEVNYCMLWEDDPLFNVESIFLHANVVGTDYTEYGQDRIIKFNLTYWDDDAQEEVLFKYDTDAIVKVYKLTWDEEGEHSELIRTYDSVAVTGGHSGEIDLSYLDAGDYKVTIQLDDGYYNIDEGSDDDYGVHEERFSVGKANVDMAIVFDKDNYVYGDDVTITVTITPQTTEEKLTEEIDLNIMGKETITKNLVDGVASFTLEDYDAGLYTSWVNFFGTDNYNDIYNYIAGFNIAKASPEITVTPAKDEFDYGEDVKIDLTLKDGDKGLSGLAIVTVDGTDYLVNIDDGEGTLSISGLAANENGYSISATVAGTDNYNAAEYDGDAKAIVLKSTDAKVDVELVDDQIVVTLTGVEDAPLDGVVYISIDDAVSVPVTVTNGKGTLDASSLSAGTHTVTASSVADSNYESVTVTKEINKGSAPNEAVITVSVESIAYGENAVVQVTFKDNEGNPLQDVLSVKIGEIETTVEIGEDGTGTASVSGLNAGHYTAIVSFAGNETYQATSKEAVFEVSKLGTVIDADEIIAYATVDKTITFTLKDANGIALANKLITVSFEGQSVQLMTDENGQVQYEINMANKGTYIISASFAGEDNYESTLASFDVVVKAQPVKLNVADATFSVSDKKYLTATLTVGGEPLANKLVTFTVNGKTYTGRTNSDGLVKVAVSLTAKKTYSVVATFGGDLTYGSAMATYRLKVTA